MTLRLRLVRNPKLEAWLAEDHRPTPHAPLYDVEEVDAARIPIRCLALGATAEQAKALVAKLNGEIVE